MVNSLRILLLAVVSFVFFSEISAQVTYTANDINPPYEGRFRPGINLKYIPFWSKKYLANIAAGNPDEGFQGIGAKSTRPGLFDSVLDIYGYAVDTSDYRNYQRLGMSDLTAIVGFPSDRNRDWATRHCPTEWSAMFKGIYEPIWDDGTDGTPYNDDNRYAAYLYETVSTYTDYVKFWEIWNEPGFYKGTDSEVFWGAPDYPGSWWVNDPDPCDYILHAPIEYYVRTLRISYEIIKTISPDDYVTIAGLGSQSFLDAILRNTDNPVDGSVTPEYPLKAGAYIDVLGFHTYPHFDGSTTFAPDNYFERHSDGAADGIISRRLAGYQSVLASYGYDGITYPKKQHICTEINIPKKVFTGDYFGGKEQQVNFITKAMLRLKENKVHQMHVYSIIEDKPESQASFEFDLMGVYRNPAATDSIAQFTDLGIAYKTSSDFIAETEIDTAKTNALNLPNEVRGYALRRDDSSYVYVLWAKTTIDKSEAASATYDFPSTLNLNQMYQYRWNFSQTGQVEQVSSSGIELDARPVFFTERKVGSDLIFPRPALTVASNQINYKDSFVVNIDWNKEVTGLDTSDLNLINGKVLKLDGQGKHYTVTIMPLSAGDVSVRLPDSIAIDTSGLYSKPSNLVIVRAIDFDKIYTDLELSISSNVVQIPKFTPVTIELEVSNVSKLAANNIVVKLPLPNQYTFVKDTTTVGNYEAFDGKWKIDQLNPNENALLALTIFALTDTVTTVYGQITACNQPDIDSKPDNGVCCMAIEDDEVALTLNDGVTSNPLSDLNLTITADRTEYDFYKDALISAVILNEGTDEAKDVTVAMPMPSGVWYLSNSATKGNYQPSFEQWYVGDLAAGESATLNISIQTKDFSKATKNYGQVTANQTPDTDSAPNNGTCCVPVEDDESAVTIESLPIFFPSGFRLGGLNEGKLNEDFTVTYFRDDVKAGVLTLGYTSSAKQLNSLLVDASGRVLGNFHLPALNKGETTTLSIGQQPAGLYILVVRTPIGNVPLKFMHE